MMTSSSRATIARKIEVWPMWDCQSYMGSYVGLNDVTRDWKHDWVSPGGTGFLRISETLEFRLVVEFFVCSQFLQTHEHDYLMVNIAITKAFPAMS